MSSKATSWAWSAEGLKSSERLTLLALADRADETNHCWPSWDRLTADTCLNRKTINSCLKSLAEKGLIEVISRTGRSSIYKLNTTQISIKSSTEIGTGKGSPTSTEIGTGKDDSTSTKNGTTPVPKLGQPKNGTSTKNGTTTSTKNGTTPVPKLVHEPKKNLKDEPNNIVCTEPKNDSVPKTNSESVVFSIPCTGKNQKEFQVTQTYIDEMAGYYPNVNMELAFKSILAWTLSNPEKRKTHRGLPAFINRWLAKAQDSGQYPKTRTEPKGVSHASNPSLSERDRIARQHSDPEYAMQNF